MPEDTTQAPVPAIRDWRLDVARLIDINGAVRRIRLGGPGLGELDYLPGQDMAVSIPTDAGDGSDGVVKRRYTICEVDRVVESVDIEVVLHGDGPGARWARGVMPGQKVEVVAPRGKITLAAAANRHLFIGDDSAIPAIMAMVAALPPGKVAHVLLEVGSEDEERELSSAEGVEVVTSWLHREDREAGSPELLVAATERMEIQSAGAHAYAFGEFGVVRSLRAVLEGKSFAPEQVSAKAYWRLGLRNAPHGEPVKD